MRLAVTLPAAIIFDVDGTIAETEEAHRAAFNAAFAEAALDWEWDEDLYRDLLSVAGGKERIRHYIHGLGARPMLAPAAIARLHVRKTELYGDLIEDLSLRPGIARLLAEARTAGVPLAIATTTSLPNIESLLVSTLGEEAPGWFAVIAAGDMVPAKKPAPDIYRFVLDRLKVRPDQCVAIEDSRNGLLSATTAGIPTVVAVSRYMTHETFPEALSVLDHLGDTGQPCHVLSGRAPPGGMVDLATLRSWLTT